jgi:hypothetical protein
MNPVWRATWQAFFGLGAKSPRLIAPKQLAPLELRPGYGKPVMVEDKWVTVRLAAACQVASTTHGELNQTNRDETAASIMAQCG